MNLLESFRAARRVSTPLIAILTPDQPATIATLCGAINGNAPAIRHDLIRGFTGCNKSGQEAIDELVGEGDVASATGNPAEALSLATKLPPGTVLFVCNAGRYLGNEAVIQAVANLRDLWKTNRRTLVLLAPDLRLPVELEQDVIVFEESLPSTEQLAEIVSATYRAAELADPPAEVLQRAVDALRGVAAFPAEQVAAMSLTKQGLNLDQLWERKRRVVEQTPGLSIWRGGERFEDIGGVENVKTLLRRVLAGAAPPRAICFVDEIEKAVAGASGDTSGVSQEMHGLLLTYLQDKEALGIIFIGPPGSAKSMVAKATGGEGGIPTIAVDISGMKGSLVGESTSNLRRALKVISAVSDDATLWIATCNSFAALSPELRRRFKLSTVYFDLPSEEEREAIWTIYLKKYSLPEQARPRDDGWTGADIRTCCELAWRLCSSLVEAAEYIVPVARSAADTIERLRQQASGKFISASYSGVYRFGKAASAPQGGRALTLE
jgi:hypothetical protein